VLQIDIARGECVQKTKIRQLPQIRYVTSCADQGATSEKFGSYADAVEQRCGVPGVRKARVVDSNQLVKRMVSRA